MAVREQPYYNDEGDEFVLHWSDSYMKIRQIETGILYDEAIDCIPCTYTYEESDEPIEEPETPSEEFIEWEKTMHEMDLSGETYE